MIIDNNPYWDRMKRAAGVSEIEEVVTRWNPNQLPLLIQVPRLTCFWKSKWVGEPDNSFTSKSIRFIMIFAHSGIQKL